MESLMGRARPIEYDGGGNPELPYSVISLSSEMAGLLHDTPELQVRLIQIAKLKTDPGLGVTLFSPKDATGVRISKVKPAGPTSRATNLLLGDVLLEVNGTPTFAVDRRSRRWFSHNDVVQALVQAGDFVSILVARDETLNHVSAPFAQASTAEERQAFVQGGRVRLCSAAGPRMQWMLDPDLICKEKELKQTLDNGMMAHYEYEGQLAAARIHARDKAVEEGGAAEPPLIDESSAVVGAWWRGAIV
jgi:hypothetical protein